MLGSSAMLNKKPAIESIIAGQGMKLKPDDQFDSSPAADGTLEIRFVYFT